MIHLFSLLKICEWNQLRFLCAGGLLLSPFLAEGSADIFQNIMNYGMGTVCLAVLLTLHAYNVKVTIPKAADLARQQLDRAIDVFREELEAERRQCHEDNVKMLEATNRNQTAITDNQTALIRILDAIKGKP